MVELYNRKLQALEKPGDAAPKREAAPRVLLLGNTNPGA